MAENGRFGRDLGFEGTECAMQCAIGRGRWQARRGTTWHSLTAASGTGTTHFDGACRAYFATSSMRAEWLSRGAKGSVPRPHSPRNGRRSRHLPPDAAVDTPRKSSKNSDAGSTPLTSRESRARVHAT